MDDRQNRALSHPKRVELLSFLADRTDGEGVGGDELAQAFNMHIRLAEYHLQVLQGADLVATVADDGGSGARPPVFVATSAA